MKKITILTVIILMAIFANATVYRVNSNPKAGAQFTNVQEAIDAASTDDIIQIESGSYPGFKVTKPLVITGTCYESAPHADIITPINPVVIESNIVIEYAGAGSSLSGFNLNSSGSSLWIKASNLNISRIKTSNIFFVSRNYNYVETIKTTALSNILISNSQIGQLGSCKNIADTLFVSNTEITNCTVERLSCGYSSTLNISCSFYFCVFELNTTTGIYNSIFQNDIIITRNTDYSGVLLSNNNSNLVDHCCFKVAAPTDLTSFNLGTNNTFEISDLFKQGNPYWELSDTSPAKGTGVDGADPGIYGGSNPFLPGGYACQPTITKLIMPTQAGNSMSVEVGATVIH